jgi:AAA+ superfamily predicted ATPase
MAKVLQISPVDPETVKRFTIWENFRFYLKTMSRFIYVVTDDEDRFINMMAESFGVQSKTTWIYNGALGLIPVEQLRRDWSTMAHAENAETFGIHDALIRIYKSDPKKENFTYIITDPDRWLRDEQVQRRLLNIAQQLNNNIGMFKRIVFVGSRKVIPEKLQRYIEVVTDPGMTEGETKGVAERAFDALHIAMPADIGSLLKGLTTHEVEQVIVQSKAETGRFDPNFVAKFRRRQIQKTDLLQYIDSGTTFSDVGGVSRFKEWARKTAAAWTAEGRAFGLKPPKGVLAVGVWGCGKSLSVKALGHEWGLPIIQLEMGKLRSSGVGESEANIYRAIRLIEAASPCLIHIDEAEKSLSGSASSGQSDAGTTSRVIGILSTWIQETKAPICIAMTANSLRTLPIEFTNRMDERFFFDMPSEEERIDILKIHLRKVRQEPDNFDLADLADRSKNMVGREIEQAVGAAMIESFSAGKPNLDNDILASEMSKKPRIFKTMADELKELLDWVGWDEDLNEGIRARLASGSRENSFKLTMG